MDYKAFLQTEVKPAYGCTDPIAVALAAAAAGRRADGPISTIHLRLSKNIYKNGLNVGIPGTQGLTGNLLAAALGAIAGNPEKGFNVLESITPSDVDLARQTVSDGRVTMEIASDVPNVYAEAMIHSHGGTVTGIVAGRPDTLKEILIDGEAVWENSAESQSQAHAAQDYKNELMNQDVASLWELASTIDDESAEFLLSGADMNQTVVEQGLSQPWGLGLGYHLQEDFADGGMLLEIKAAAAAAADVRMAGGPFPVMSSGGSGNHGITAIVPVTVLAKHLGSSERELAEALMLSHLVTGFIKAHTGLLTPTCGCAVAAGLGAAMAMVRLLGGDPHQAEIAASSTLSAVLGMICDGAKGSCAFKVSTAAGEAFLSAKMAMNNRGVDVRQGLVNPSIKEMAHVIGTLSNAETSDMDKKILDLILETDSTC